MGHLKLSIDLIPNSAWFKSLYRVYEDNGKRSDWYKIKDYLYEKEGRVCFICGSDAKPLEAHETWEYDKWHQVQKLKEIHHLCGLCHKIKHFAFWTIINTEKLKEQGLSENSLIEHFCKVNKCPKKVFDLHKSISLKLYRQRSKIKWRQDFLFLETLNLEIAIPHFNDDKIVFE